VCRKRELLWKELNLILGWQVNLRNELNVELFVNVYNNDDDDDDEYVDDDLILVL
jgi:hypothetical protein